MAKKELSILIVNYNTSAFVKLSIFALEKLSSYPYHIYIMDNNSEKKDYESLKKHINNNENVSLFRNETNLTGSIAHGTALNELVTKVKTPYFSILDADATWLKKGWDKILLNKLDNKIKVIGTQASGNKPKDFPLMFAILFETETLIKLNIDFRPKDISLLQDTGWEIREKYLKAGFKGKYLDYLNTRTYKKGPFKKIIAGEYYLDNNYSQIFASHFGRGSSLGYAKYNRGFTRILYKIPFFGKHLLRRKGIYEKNKWIEICKTIINEQ